MPISPDVQSALDDIARCQSWCKEQYWLYMDHSSGRYDPKMAACFSRQAAAYEYAHAIFARAVGAHSEWADAA